MILDLMSVVSIGLLVGTEFAVSAFVNPILARLEPAAEAHATTLFARTLGQVMPFWYALNLLLLIIEVWIHGRGSAIGWLAAAPVIWSIVIVFTVLILVPINNRIAAMDPTAFSDQLKREHTRWDVLHRWRVLALSVAMITLLIGIRA